jgi:hypothetical protein
MRRLRTVHGLSTKTRGPTETGSPHDHFLPSVATSRLHVCTVTVFIRVPFPFREWLHLSTRLSRASNLLQGHPQWRPLLLLERQSVDLAPSLAHLPSSDVIRGHQRSSEVIRGHQRSTLLRRWRTLTRGGSSRDLGTWAQVRTSHAPDEGSHWGDEGRRNQAHSRRRVRTCPCTPELHPVDDELLNQMLIRS